MGEAALGGDHVEPDGEVGARPRDLELGWLEAAGRDSQLTAGPPPMSNCTSVGTPRSSIGVVGRSATACRVYATVVTMAFASWRSPSRRRSGGTHFRFAAPGCESVGGVERELGATGLQLGGQVGGLADGQPVHGGVARGEWNAFGIEVDRRLGGVPVIC